MDKLPRYLQYDFEKALTENTKKYKKGIIGIMEHENTQTDIMKRLDYETFQLCEFRDNMHERLNTLRSC